MVRYTLPQGTRFYYYSQGADTLPKPNPDNLLARLRRQYGYPPIVGKTTPIPEDIKVSGLQTPKAIKMATAMIENLANELEASQTKVWPEGEALKRKNFEDDLRTLIQQISWVIHDEPTDC